MNLSSFLLLAAAGWAEAATPGRDRSSFNYGWKFQRFTSNPDSLSYSTLKSWMLPLANNFIVSGNKNPAAPGTAPGANVQYVQASFNDASWQSIDLPHDWAISGPFNSPGISGGMGRLPCNGVGWYRRTYNATSEDVDGTKSIFLDFDGAMSYAAVWLNGNLLGGWPYGYASWRVDMTKYLKAGSNIIAVRLDNALDNSRVSNSGSLFMCPQSLSVSSEVLRFTPPISQRGNNAPETLLNWKLLTPLCCSGIPVLAFTGTLGSSRLTRLMSHSLERTLRLLPCPRAPRRST